MIMMLHKIPCIIHKSIHETKHKFLFYLETKWPSTNKFKHYLFRHKVVFCFTTAFYNTVQLCHNGHLCKEDIFLFNGDI